MSINSPIYGQRSLPESTKRAWIYRAIIGCVTVCAGLGLFRSVYNHNVLELDPVESALNESVEGTPDRPIVGILSLPLTESFREIHHIHQEGVRAVIPSSYVRWLQSAGAQVIVIPHFWPQAEIRELVAKLSGILFTGGDYGDDAWNATTAMIFNEAVRRNGTGDPLALWATCLGYERILQVASEDDHHTVVEASVMDESLPVSWKKDQTSAFMSFMGHEALSKFETHDIAYNFHHWGVTPESWKQHETLLDQYFNILGMHKKGPLEFVAMIEGKDGLPIWAVQFHPEKALFEWSPMLHYPHSEVAVLNNRKIADFFVNQVRKFAKMKSSRGFDNFEDESKYAVYNYPTIFTGADVNATHSVFTETYIIN